MAQLGSLVIDKINNRLDCRNLIPITIRISLGPIQWSSGLVPVVKLNIYHEKLQKYSCQLHHLFACQSKCYNAEKTERIHIKFNTWWFH